MLSDKLITISAPDGIHHFRQGVDNCDTIIVNFNLSNCILIIITFTDTSTKHFYNCPSVFTVIPKT